MRRKNSLRIQSFNYSFTGYYFVTICTKDKKHHFGEVRDEKMILTLTGKIVENCWNEIPGNFKNIALDNYVVMPNHLHGILIIQNVGVANLRPVPTKRNQMLIPKAVREFKAAVSRQVRSEINNTFSWQRSYYDRVIRNEAELNNIRRYMANNVLKWEMDIENRKNGFGKIRKIYYEEIYNG